MCVSDEFLVQAVDGHWSESRVAEDGEESLEDGGSAMTYLLLEIIANVTDIVGTTNRFEFLQIAKSR